MSDSSRMFIISEPPPFVEIDTLVNLFKKFNITLSTQTRRIGIDGFGKDIIVVIANATTENIENLAKNISKYFYQTDYKIPILPISEENKKIYFSKNNLNVSVTLDEIDEWFLSGEERFIVKNDSFSISQILSQKKYGTFFSEKPGFVIWVFPKKDTSQSATSTLQTSENTNTSQQNHEENINIEHLRQFTLDADLILGAISDSVSLAIIGRERETNLNEMPPLRIETILLLASITDKELSQSLDLNDMLAGKMENGEDWSPTYLSKELENTEFGHLLTITDILLKDWSESGTIKEAYYRYPEPGYYPFDKPLFNKLGLNELVYNWNTANTMYAIDIDNKTLYSVDRTGSLPVSYFNSQNSHQSIGNTYENRAYNYFSNMNCCDLARVVQYVALYQIFIDNNIHYDGNLYSAIPSSKSSLLRKPLTILFNNIKLATPNYINLVADSLTQEQFSIYIKTDIERQLKRNENNYNFSYTEEQKNKIYEDVYKDTKNDNISYITKFQNILKNTSDEDFEKLISYVAYPRGYTYNKANYATIIKGRDLLNIIRKTGNNVHKYFGVKINDVKNYYINSLNRSASKYLKSSSAIITFNDIRATGGHNISSKINRVNRTKGYRVAHSVPVETQTYPAPNTNPDNPKTPNKQKTENSPKTTNNPKAIKSPQTKTVVKSVNPQVAAQPNSNKNVRERSRVISTENRAKRGL
ncbi:hypothetical protein FACS1894153_0140 [Bacteroidia bacterium]|nr:hypothetical protein FACS1894153_0140 [Bacteroidia bacterium]